MSTLVIKKNTAALRRREFIYLLVSLFLLLFGAVYEHFSHGVYSYFMLYAFTVPLLGGLTMSFLFDMFAKIMPGKMTFAFYDCGLAAGCTGCLIQGVLDIYGTTNRLMAVYWIASYIFLSAALLMFLAGWFTRGKG